MISISRSFCSNSSGEITFKTAAKFLLQSAKLFGMGNSLLAIPRSIAWIVLTSKKYKSEVIFSFFSKSERRLFIFLARLFLTHARTYL